MNISRRWFIGGAASLGAFQGCRFVESPFGRNGVARLKFGVISDIHVQAESSDRGKVGNTFTLRRAFRWFDAQGADAVMIAGDLANSGLISQLQCVADAWDAVFPGGRSRRDGRPVERLFIYGNHDWEGYRYGKQEIVGHQARDLVNDHICRFGMKRTWEEVFGEAYAPVYSKVVNGYTFVGAHWDGSAGTTWAGNPGIEPFFAAHGKEIDPSQPFFFFQHPHPKDTCYGSWAWGHDDGRSTRALSKYPNAVAFSGHSHYSLLDERSIWQGAFTSLGAGSLRYSGEPCEEFADAGGFENAGGKAKNRPGSEERLMTRADNNERNGLLVSVYGDHVTLTRRDFMRDADLGPDWVMPLPAAESKPFAFAEHAKRFAAPEFAAEARLAVARGVCKVEANEKKGTPARDFDVLNVTVPAARQTFANRVWRYDLRIERKRDGAAVLTRRVLSPDYHLPLGEAVKEMTVPVQVVDVPKDDEFRFVAIPYNCFGRAGKALAGEWMKI